MYSVNSDGLTPLDVAFLSNNRELVRLLLAHGAMEGKPIKFHTLLNRENRSNATLFFIFSLSLETSMKNLESHLLNLLGEAERRVLELRLCGNQDTLQTKSLALWERRKRGLKKMLVGFEHASK